MISSISQVIKAAKNIMDKVNIFKRDLSYEDIINNPFACVMIQSAIVDGNVSKEEQNLIEKILKSVYSFSDAEALEKSIHDAIDKEKSKRTDIDQITAKLVSKKHGAVGTTEYDNKVQLVTFAYLVAMEDNNFDKREEDYISELLKELEIQKKDWERTKVKIKHDFMSNKQDRDLEIYKKVTEYSLLKPNLMYENPIIRLTVHFAMLDNKLAEEEREKIKTMTCSIFGISRIAVNFSDVFESTIDRISKDRINVKEEVEEIQSMVGGNVNEEAVVRFLTLIASKSQAEAKDKGMKEVQKIIDLLQMDEQKAEQIVDSVSKTLSEDKVLEKMKGKVVYNSISGAYIGTIIGETSNKEKWIAKHHSGIELIYEVGKDFVFTREV